ncbi:cation transporter [Cellulomonas bogoriensis]|uniref:Cobalt transporter n=1 Tax=Cellulomonas bogoriensis 69B4 = DSM 16987 TaxID=1386082 RepID=A0A0A0BYL9_9CELL|nr:cation transporter [Cellulomonas bogoriensis]KGM13036.1 cobalt transporter [Cellulomonas bogoriensis 69B4 = DSM 16987]
MSAPLETDRVTILRRRVGLIVTATISYNVIEALVAIPAGAAASSAALIGFGLDSIVEVLSAAAIAWQLAGGRDPREREHVTLRLIAFSFFGLAVFVSIDAMRSLAGHGEPEHSTVGLVLACVSLVVMPALSLLERRTGRELGSAAVVADSKQTMICAALSAVLLAGLVLNSAFGLWWADPVGALVIPAVATREGIEALRGDTCCSPVTRLLQDAPPGAGEQSGACDSDVSPPCTCPDDGS